MQITLSNFRLSGFVILVFSKQKGITVVFRNDPLESLKVSSTFDSIPFVRDFLQKAIESQLRILFMDELPAIIHRLSLRLWVPEYAQELERSQKDTVPPDAPVQDPFLNPPCDPVDSSGNLLTSSEIGSLSLDSSVEMHPLFSQKNLLRLAALADSQRTLSLFTPSIQDVVYRACMGPEPGDSFGGTHSPRHSILPRPQSYSFPSSPSLSSGYVLAMGPGRHSKAHATKKKKRRVVNLRRPKATDDSSSVASSDSNWSEMTETATTSSMLSSEPIEEEPGDGPPTPLLSPQRDSRLAAKDMPIDPRATMKPHSHAPKSILSSPAKLGHRHVQSTASEKGQYPVVRSPIEISHHAWMMQMAGEIARRIQSEKSASVSSDSGLSWDRRMEETPPPAYGQ